MAWSFGDSFDLYASTADMANGYWDSSAGTISGATLPAGRFTGSQALNFSVTTGISFTKSSAANDAVHHLVVAFRQTAAISGATLGTYLELFDGATAQCSIVLRSDGAILLTSGGPAGTVLDTYTGAVAAQNTWYAFEIEVVINNTTGSWAVRKNGNTSNDHALGSLNTRGSANNYANRLTVGFNASVNAQLTDDLFWQSGAATGTWLGDIRCYTRMPASDASVQFSKAPSSVVQSVSPVSGSQTSSATLAYYTMLVATYDGTVGSISISLNAGFTGNIKCSVFNASTNNNVTARPTTVITSATTINNPATGTSIFTITPFSVTKGTLYILGFITDGAYTNAYSYWSNVNFGLTTTTTYAAFPVANPTASTTNINPICSWTLTVGTNNGLVNEAQQDGTTSYVYDSTVNDADFYTIGSIASTPATTIAVTTRGYMQKSDAGSRTAAVQLKSGATTVAATATALTTSGWQWNWRMDLTDPNTSAAWTAAAVNNAQIGPLVVS